MDIELNKVRKTYPRGGAPALEIDRLVLRGGQSHGIVGQSGSGKSTLLNLLALLDRPDPSRPGEDGSIRFFPEGADGPCHRWGSEQPGALRRAWQALVALVRRAPLSKPVGDMIDDENAWRREYYSFIFQAGYLLRNLPMLENVLLPLEIQRRVTEHERKYARKTLELLNLTEEKWSALGWQMSGGEYQRTAVARSLVHHPQVIFADEPTGSLDGNSARQVMDMLKRWRSETTPGRQNLLILVTHNPQHAWTYCEHITVLHNSKIIKDGPRESFKSLELLTSAMGGDLSGYSATAPVSALEECVA